MGGEISNERVLRFQVVARNGLFLARFMLANDRPRHLTDRTAVIRAGARINLHSKKKKKLLSLNRHPYDLP